MGLFEEIDKKATIARVQDFFDDEDKYPTIKRRSGDWGLKSPTMDITGVSGSTKGNSQENKAIRFTEYQQAMRAIRYAIAGCSDRSSKILKYRFIDSLPDYKVRELVRLYGHSSYKRARDYACWEFADTIDVACNMFCVNRKIIPDFHKKREDSGKKTGTKREENGNTAGTQSW